jgi:DNA-binding transcriptional ArsR family regulator
MSIKSVGRNHRVYSVPELLKLEDDPNRWIIPGVVPVVGRTIVYGDGGTGKTTIIMDLAIAVASDRRLLKQFPINKTGPVLFISTEGSILDNRDRVMVRLRSHSLDPSTVQFYFCQDSFDMDNDNDVAELTAYIEELKPLIVVCDPLDSFIRGDENSAKETKALRRKFDKLINAYSFSLIVIHHENKAGGIRGSTAWRDWTDTELHITSVEQALSGIGQVKVITLTAEKVRNGRDGKVLSLVALPASTTGGLEYEFYDGQNAENVVAAWLKQRVYKQLLDDGALLLKDLAEKLNVAQAKVSSTLSQLEQAKLVDQQGSVLKGSRNLSAWRVTQRMSLVDAAAAILQYQKQRAEEDTAAIVITPTVDADTE